MVYLSKISIHLKTQTMLFRLFLFCVSLLPLVSLYWEEDLGIFKINWIVYPIFLIGFVISFFLRSKISSQFLVLLTFTFLYLILSLFREGQVETVFRFFLAMLPLTLYTTLEKTQKFNLIWFWVLYLLCFAMPLWNAYLQHTGVMDFNEFDVVNGEYLGRVSGGYSKPMNFIAFLLPIYLLGFYQWLIKGRRLIGWVIICFVLVIIFIIGHRTSLFAFLVILVSSSSKSFTVSTIVNYYKYFLNFFSGVLSFIFFYLLNQTFGVIDIIRGRVWIWEAHATQFLESRFDYIFFGRQEILLEKGNQLNSIQIIGEVHNNSFRTIIFFGLFGFLIYSLLIRFLVLRISRSEFSSDLMFIIFSSFTYFIFYTITNEPVYYASVLWPVLLWVFIANLVRTENTKYDG